jgi:hypothetical protein
MSVVNDFGSNNGAGGEMLPVCREWVALHRAGDGALETTVDQALIRGLDTAFRVPSRGCSGV